MTYRGAPPSCLHGIPGDGGVAGHTQTLLVARLGTTCAGTINRCCISWTYTEKICPSCLPLCRAQLIGGVDRGENRSYDGTVNSSPKIRESTCRTRARCRLPPFTPCFCPPPPSLWPACCPAHEMRPCRTHSFSPSYILLVCPTLHKLMLHAASCCMLATWPLSGKLFSSLDRTRGAAQGPNLCPHAQVSCRQ